MTATAEKARFFLEQSVPELKEFERKKIFSPEEISTIAKKRSDFEHKINARGSTVKDYIQYAEFEIAVDALRKKRVKRLSIKSTAHNGQRRIFFVFDRATRKFPGDVGLWTQSVEYARRQKAYKKAVQILTSALRLHPAKPDLWIYAASCAMDDRADMNEARSYMQRGLRFIKNTRSMWVEYARLELAYMAKIHARRQVLGVGQRTNKETNRAEQGPENDDMIRLPRLTADDIAPTLSRDEEIDEIALQRLDETPVMTGAIPIAIFGSAMTQFHDDPATGHQFFETAADFGHVPAIHTVLNHMLSRMQQIAPHNWHTTACNIAMPMIGVSSGDSGYPSALRLSLKQMADGMSSSEEKTNLSQWCKGWLEIQLQGQLDPGIETVIKSKLASLN